MIGYMGEDPESGVLSIATGIVTGDYRGGLERMRADAADMDRRMAEIRGKLETAPNDAARQKIFGEYQRANADVVAFKLKLNQAISKYNEIADAFNKYSVGALNIQRVGMSGLPAIALVIAAATAAGYALAEVVKQFGAAFNGASTAAIQAKGSIEQLTDLMKQWGLSVQMFGDTLVKVALVGAGLFAAYNAFKWFQGRKRTGSSSSSAQLALPDLKPVDGRVVS